MSPFGAEQPHLLPGAAPRQKWHFFQNFILLYPRQYYSDLHQIFRSWSHNQGSKNGQQIIQKIIPPLGAALTTLSPYSKSRYISANYEPIFTKFSGKLPQTIYWRICTNYFSKYIAPSWGNPIPHIMKYLPISANYKRICTIVSGISLPTRR